MKKISKTKKFFVMLMVCTFFVQVCFMCSPSNNTKAAAAMALPKASKNLLVGTWKMSDGTTWLFAANGQLTMTEPKTAPLKLAYKVVANAKKANFLTITLMVDAKTKGDSMVAEFTANDTMLLNSEKLTRITKKASSTKFSLSGFQLVFNFLTSKWKGANGMIIEPKMDAKNSVSEISITGDPNNVEGGPMLFKYKYDPAMKAGNTFVLILENVNYEYAIKGVYSDDSKLSLTFVERRSKAVLFKDVKFTRVPRKK
jgi:hypothetical protein